MILVHNVSEILRLPVQRRTEESQMTGEHRTLSPSLISTKSCAGDIYMKIRTDEHSAES